jgi:hypothetical protein
MTAQSPFLSEQTGHGPAASVLDTSACEAPMPGPSFIPQRPNGNGQYRENPATPDYPRDSQAQKVVEAIEEASWYASLLKQAWPYLLIVISFIFTAGVAWQKLQSSQEKIEVIAAKVESHSQALGDIREGVAAIRAVVEAEQRRAAQYPVYSSPSPIAASAPLAPSEASQAPLSPRPAAISPKKIQAAKKPLQAPAPKSFLCTSAGIGC